MSAPRGWCGGAAHQQSVGRLPGLGDKHAGVVPEDGAPPVHEVRGQLQGHRHFHELLHRLPAGEAGVVGRATCNEHDAPAAPDGGDVVDEAPQRDAPLMVGVPGWVHSLHILNPNLTFVFRQVAQSRMLMEQSQRQEGHQACLSAGAADDAALSAKDALPQIMLCWCMCNLLVAVPSQLRQLQWP